MKSKILFNHKVSTEDRSKCDAKNCNRPGIFKAPKDRQLKEYFNFCEKHVAEYNKNWNFYDGMSPEEIERENTKDIYKRNPTWNFGINFKHANDLYDIFDGMFQSYRCVKRPVDKKINDALKIMGLSYPICIDELKIQYKKLVKKYHPDLSKNEKDKKIKEEKFKQIIDAYQKIDKFLKNNK